MQKIHYEISFDTPQTHLFQVSCIIKKPDAEGQIVSLPAWLPGSYLIRDFARHIISISAHDTNGSISISKLDKQTWQCGKCTGTLTIKYSVYAYDLSVRTTYLDTHRAYFNGSSVFLQVNGQEKSACSVNIKSPGKPYKDWQVGTSMPTTKVDDKGYGLYTAQDYSTLIDYPVEIGELSIAEFKAGGKPHRIIVSGKHQADLKKISKDLKTLCNYHIAFFGEAPFDRYDFLLYAAGDDQYGGLEHSDSTSLICPRSWLPVKGEMLNKQGYQDFLGLCSHEYFHAWHVKRIKPKAFADANLSREAYTQLLWVFEGFTAYYDSLALVKSGLISREDYLKDLSTSITRYLNTPGRSVQTVTESSFDAWIKLYKPDENTPNAQISYYLKGSLVALILDLSLRQGGQSLDVVMQQLWREHKALAVNEDRIEQIISAVGGKRLAPLLRSALYSTEELPLGKILPAAGINYTLEIAGNSEAQRLSDVGFKLASANEAKVASVYSGSAAEAAGLAGGDVVIAVNRIKVNAKNIEQVISHKPAGSKLSLHVFRRDELLALELVTEAAQPNSCKLSQMDKVSTKIKAIRDGWLGVNSTKNS